MKTFKFFFVAALLLLSSESFAQFSNVRGNQRGGNRATISSTSTMSENGPKTGYKGFVELGYTPGVGEYGENRLNFMTAHGCQCSPFFFIGVGTGINYYTSPELVSVPIFADFRGTFIDSGISPFIDLKAGYSIIDVDGLFISPSVGCRFGIGKNTAMNISVGYEMQFAEYYGYGHTERKNCGGLALKLGIDF